MGISLKGIAKAVIKKGAPILGAVIGGPAGGAFAAKLVAPAFGADPEDPIEDLIAKINADPEASEKLKELEQNHKEKLIELKLDGERIRLEEAKSYLDDKQSARSREIAIVEKLGKRDWNLTALSFTIVVAFFGTIVLIIAKGVPEQSENIVYLLLGGLVSAFSTVIAYYFGSSKGSSDKTRLSAIKK